MDSGDLSPVYANENEEHVMKPNEIEAPHLANFEQNPLHNTKIHRLSPTHLLLTSGLAGDSRTLASAFRRIIASWTHVQYGESISVREVAREMGTVRHGIGLRPGARVLGVVGVLIGLEDVYCEDWTRVEVRMYKSLPGGTMDRCNLCCMGGGADSLGRRARKETMEYLSRVLALSSGNKRDLSGKSQQLELKAEKSTGIDDADEGELKRVIEEVGKAALKHHPFVRDDGSPDKSISSESLKRAAVDIWVVRAIPKKYNGNAVASLDFNDTTTTNSCASDVTPTSKETPNNKIGPVFQSLHRSLGDTSINIRCASRVSLEQLSQAVKSLTTRD
jgi:20S proteasome alpha/beta subunit